MRSGIIQRQIEKLDNYQKLYIEEKSSLITQLADHEEYLEHKDIILDVLNDAHRQLQTKTQDFIAGLLTSLVNEVMPHNNDQVVIETGIKSNKNTLEFLIQSEGGVLENIFADRGGSIQNIVSMGLRFVMLSRLQNRRILFFDESDCWLSPKYIRPFAKIMSELSVKLGVQVIYVSHHNHEAFSGLARRIHLTKENGVISSQIKEDMALVSIGGGLDGDQDESLYEGIGWRYIRLNDYRAHENTYIELSPCLNIITGDNDIGKSSVIDAIRSVVHNEGRESIIRHGANEANVEIGIEDNFTLQWSYRKRGVKKTAYNLTSDENELIETHTGSNDVPPWLNDYFAMPDFNGIDIHIASQDQPNFLIDRSVSTHFRAQALSLDDDTKKVQMMMKLHAEKLKDSKREINHGQKSLAKLKNKLGILRDIYPAIEIYNEAIAIESGVNKIKDELSLLKGLSNNIEEYETKISALDTLPKLDQTPNLENDSELLSIGKRISDMESQLRILESVETLSLENDFEKIANEIEEENIFNSLNKLTQLVSIINELDDCAIPQLPVSDNFNELLQIGKGISQLDGELKKLNAEVSKYELDYESALTDKKEFINLSGICPACNQPVNNGVNNHVH